MKYRIITQWFWHPIIDTFTVIKDDTSRLPAHRQAKRVWFRCFKAKVHV